MAISTTVSGLGHTWNLPNFAGPLYNLYPEETPFLSMVGSLAPGGGFVSDSYDFTYSVHDNKAPSQPSIIEGDDPTYEEIDRVERSNVTQIFQYGVKLSYTKLAATGRLGDYASNRAWSVMSSLGQGQPVRDENSWQLQNKFSLFRRDVNFTMLRGVYQRPTDNSTGRQTRGILPAVTSNVLDQGAAVGADWTFDFTAGAQEDLWTTSTAHNLNVGDEVVFTTDGGGAPEYEINKPYFVVAVPLTTTVQLSATKGGPVLAGTADSTGNWAARTVSNLTTAMLNELIRKMVDSKNVNPAKMRRPVLLTGSVHVLQRISDIYGFAPESRRMGGVSINSILLDGISSALSVRYDHDMEPNTLLLADLAFCAPVFLPTPGKGIVFAEPLAQTGAAINTQIYADLGLDSGPEEMHGKIRYLATEPV